MTHHSIDLSETLHVSDSFTARTESDYLLISNKNKCTELLRLVTDGSFSEEQAIDFLISLHIVLEVGLNTFFRHISLMAIKKSVDPLEISKNLDEISFRDKATLFIYNSKFNFDNRIDEATRHHKIIGLLKNFAEPRNKLLHGHSISTVTDGDAARHSQARSLTGQERVNKQIENFRLIMQGMRFYLDCLESGLTDSGKASLAGEYLNDNFLSVSSG